MRLTSSASDPTAYMEKSLCANGMPKRILPPGGGVVEWATDLTDALTLMKRICLLAALATAPLALAETSSKPPAKIDVSSLPQQTQLIDDVVVPVPSEIFAVLDKIGSPKWADVLRPSKGVARPIGEQPQIALQLGTVIAEGFIAVEAEDTAEVKNIGNSVRNLAKALNVDKTVNQVAQAIIDAADAKDWAAVRKELQHAMTKVKEAMIEMRSEHLSQLVSLGGWLRGTEALTDVVEKDFTRDGADLLHQPLLIDHFEKRLQTLPPKFRRHRLVTELLKGLQEIRPLVGNTQGAQISEKTVKEVGAIAERLVESVNSRR